MPKNNVEKPQCLKNHIFQLKKAHYPQTTLEKHNAQKQCQETTMLEKAQCLEITMKNHDA